VATGSAYTVRDFLQFSFEHVNLDWQRYVRFDERYLRPTEVDSLIGDPPKALTELGWAARVHTPQLATLMVDADLATTQHLDLRGGGAHQLAGSGDALR
jgi:GDPmannose 4,6-dehydratase